MTAKYFEDTDTLYLIYRESQPVETRDLDEDTLLDYDEEVQLVSITIEHARDKVGDPEIKFEKIGT